MPFIYTINTQGGEPRTGGPYPSRAELHKAIQAELLQGGLETHPDTAERVAKSTGAPGLVSLPCYEVHTQKIHSKAAGK